MVGVADSYRVFFRWGDRPENPVETAIESSLRAGVATSRSGDGVFDRYRSGRHTIPRSGGFDVETVVDHVREDGGGTLKFLCDGVYVSLHVPTLDPDPDATGPTMSLHLVDADVVDLDVARFADWVASLSAAFDVEWALGEGTLEGWDEEAWMDSDSPVEVLERLPWISAFAPGSLAALGGRERVLETPAWRVEELQTGHVLAVLTDDAWRRREGADSAEDHLLVGR